MRENDVYIRMWYPQKNVCNKRKSCRSYEYVNIAKKKKIRLFWQMLPLIQRNMTYILQLPAHEE